MRKTAMELNENSELTLVAELTRDSRNRPREDTKC